MCSLTDNYKLYGPFFGNFGSHRVDERTNVSRFNNNVFITREKSIEYCALLLNLKGMLNSEKAHWKYSRYDFTVGNISKERYKLFLFSFSLSRTIFFLYIYIYFFLHANTF